MNHSDFIKRPLVPYNKSINISLKTAETWIAAGVIWLSSIGQENVYFENEFGMQFFFKASDEVWQS